MTSPRTTTWPTGGRILLATALLLGIAWLTPAPRAAGRGEPGPYYYVRLVLVDELADLKRLVELDIDIDAVFTGWARVHVIGEELAILRGLGYQVTLLPNPAPLMAARAQQDALTGKPPRYHTYNTLTQDLEDIAADHQDITRLTSIGQSVQGRELWMMKITRNPDLEEDEPEAAYIAAMHGDEVVGKELCFYFIDYLTDNDGSDPRVTALLDDTEIWILPSMNPDGTESGSRLNANGVDLNRNFPDQFIDPNNTPDGREPETQAVMLWGAAHATNLSANFHGGALVANYPFDSNTQGLSIYSPSPDDTTFVSLSRTYADNNPSMLASNSHPAYNNGITNGADWYSINGGMQDWNYVWRGDFDNTLELGVVKWPDASQLPTFWEENRESMFSYLERVHEGVRGLVTDAGTGAPLAATVRVAGNDFTTATDPDRGDYHRMLSPGRYTLEVSSPGYATRLIDPVVVTGGPAVRHDVALKPEGLNLQVREVCDTSGPECVPWLEPGETADLAVTVRNLDLAQTTIRGRLEPAGWFPQVQRPEADYPDLLPDETGQSLAPHHGVTLAPSTPSGYKAGFVLRWDTDQGPGQSKLFHLPVGEPACTLVAATDLPLSITDRSTTVSTLEVLDEMEIAGIEVAVDILHPGIGDLRVEVVSPAGSAVALHNRSGGSADNILGTYGEDLTPFEPLSRVQGETSPGTWSLRINDGVPGNQGSLQAWSLEVCGRPLEAHPPEMRFRRLRMLPEGIRLTWWAYPDLDSYRIYRSANPSSAGAFSDVTGEDPDPSDTSFLDTTADPLVYWLVTGVGRGGEGPKGHFGE